MRQFYKFSTLTFNGMLRAFRPAKLLLKRKLLCNTMRIFVVKFIPPSFAKAKWVIEVNLKSKSPPFIISQKIGNIHLEIELAELRIREMKFSGLHCSALLICLSFPFCISTRSPFFFALVAFERWNHFNQNASGTLWSVAIQLVLAMFLAAHCV